MILQVCTSAGFVAVGTGVWVGAFVASAAVVAGAALEQPNSEDSTNESTTTIERILDTFLYIVFLLSPS